jgi:hypothetical protein
MLFIIYYKYKYESKTKNNLSSKMTATTFPMSLINEMLKADGINNWETSYYQFRWNTFENKYVTRKFFTEEYLETKFKMVIAYLHARSWSPPQVTQFFLEPVNEECSTEILYSVEEFEEKLLWGVTIQFPKKTFRNNYLIGEMNYRFVYSYFENGKGGYNCAFIEDNSCEDTLNDEFNEPLFHRAYVSLNGALFPFFKEPTTHYETLNNMGHYVSIKYLNKDLGMVTKIADNFGFYYYDFTVSKKCDEYYQYQNRWFTYIKERYYMFTKNELKQLHRNYQENDDEYEYDSECDL